MGETALASVGSRHGIVPQWLATSQTVLFSLLVVEIAVFALIGRNFFTWTNFFEVPRLSVELGLLSLGMTLVIVTGGIDLSVGSLLGLSAVVFGKLWRDFGFSTPAASAATLALAATAGGLNGLLITRLRIPPLIVTLGTYSLFRGLAEGMTGGVDNFTDFPEGFLSLGQGYWGGVPAQMPILLVAAVMFWVVLHRGVIGRELSAIGYSARGRSPCRDLRRAANRVGVCRIGGVRRIGCDCVCRSRRTSQGRCGDWL
jgi:rhamnose transport system permease protein